MSNDKQIIYVNTQSSDKCCCPYCCCDKPQKECCFPSLSNYCELALVTDTRQVFGVLPPGEKNDPCCDICLCITFMPLRFVVTLPCFFGAAFNSCIGLCTKKKKNYLF
jgi:hypothetical protein